MDWKAIVEIIDGDSLNRSTCSFDANNVPCGQTRLSELNKGQIKIGSDTTARVQWVSYFHKYISLDLNFNYFMHKLFSQNKLATMLVVMLLF